MIWKANEQCSLVICVDIKIYTKNLILIGSLI